MNLTLYEITDQVRTVLSEVMAAGGEITDQQWEALEKAQGSLAEKSDGYGHVMRNLDTLAETIKAEEARLRDRRQTLENAVGKMKERIYGAMKALDTREIKGTLFTFRIQKSPPSVEIGNPHELPEAYVDVEIVRKPKREDIKRALQAGHEVTGAALKQGEHLRVV